ncbi:MAG: sodium-dependent transporter, partial [Thermoplasmata archaeon]|nr:sodium-dependent transporter [Thermoplasmata archaeon]
MTDEEEEREVWPSRTGFVLAAMGSAIGLGNVWRFPYYCYKYGGGAFLVPYFIALFTTGIPLMILEYSVGQKFRTSAPVAFAKMDKRFGWVGWFALIMSMVVMLYYTVILSWSVLYMGKSFNLSWGADTKDYFLNDFLNLSNGPGD